MPRPRYFPAEIRDGELEGFRRQAAEMMRPTREKDAETVRYDRFISEDGTRCEVREGYEDADGLVEHAYDVREAGGYDLPPTRDTVPQ
jgi:quinol monooxygenase YgiN